MASFVDTSPSANRYFGNPIVYKVNSAAISGNDVAFHRVKMDVTVTAPDLVTTHYELSQPVGGSSSQRVEFDISSCMRAAANLYEFKPVSNPNRPVTYPEFTATCVVKDVWVQNGQAQETSPVSTSFSAYIGRFSDYELRGGSALTASFTRKPAEGELVFPGDKIVYAHAVTSEDEQTHKQTQTVQSAIQNVSSTAAAYSSVAYNGSSMRATVVPVEANSCQFQFVNSRGCVESIRAFGRTSEQMVSSKKENIISRFEYINQFSRTMLRKTLQPSDLTFSSGFVSYQWAKWWAYEFCMGQQHWMLLPNGNWLPVLVSINDSTTIIDRNKVELCHIDFTVRPDGNGGLW